MAGCGAALQKAPDALEQPLRTFLRDEVSAVGDDFKAHVIGVVAVAERDASRQTLIRE